MTASAMDEDEIVAEALEDEGFDFFRDAGYNWKRLQDARGYASFSCKHCHRDWSSYNAWISIDVENPSIARKFEQKCKRCETPRKPHFTEDEIRSIVEYIVKRMMGRLERRPERMAPRPLNAPHDQSRCSKCNYGAGPPCSAGRNG
eukprot:m.311394 g.311394  ORF g.311394 m.311394 type:complete len:146 (+) comp67984_c0_seq1:84-521(+)